jgi:tRNA(fMet)-specific endonuclease VapC
MKETYMLDTDTCSYIMREHPKHIIIKLQEYVEKKHRIVISAITYSELRFGAIGKKASSKHNIIVDEFMSRIDEVLPWHKKAVETTALIKKDLNDLGTQIGDNDTMIAGHAIADDCVLITNNEKHFKRVQHLNYTNWV